MAQPTIVLAGAAGDLGTRIAQALVERGTSVRALVRNDASAADRNRLSALGLTVAPTDIGDTRSIAGACEGAACVVSALNGLHDVIVERQGMLLDGAARRRAALRPVGLFGRLHQDPAGRQPQP